MNVQTDKKIRTTPLEELKVGDIITCKGISDEFLLVASPLVDAKKGFLSKYWNKHDAEMEYIVCNRTGEIDPESQFKCLKISFNNLPNVQSIGHLPNAESVIRTHKEIENLRAKQMASPLANGG